MKPEWLEKMCVRRWMEKVRWVSVEDVRERYERMRSGARERLERVHTHIFQHTF